MQRWSITTKFIISTCLTILSSTISHYFPNSIYLLGLSIALLYANAFIIPFFKYNFNNPWGIPLLILLFINLSLMGDQFNKVGSLFHTNTFGLIVIKIALFAIYAFIVYRRFNPAPIKRAPRSK